MRQYDLTRAHWFKSSYSNGHGGDCVEVSYDFTSASWRKSSYSNGEGGDCVEVSYDFTGTTWRKSSHSNGEGGSCVEVLDGVPGVIPVRDSKVPDGPALVVPEAAWATFVDGVKA
ncbi:DUF397 domain-containing protein [Streptomyces sp. NPDC046203]|uniref:DUF397 domain-containing protein n=1 Tax=Streptomyces sp. NPDC046203 TaxID=3154602 RepID=UPI0033F7EB69